MTARERSGGRMIAGVRVGKAIPEQVLRDADLLGRVTVDELVVAARELTPWATKRLTSEDLIRGAGELRRRLGLKRAQFPARSVRTLERAMRATQTDGVVLSSGSAAPSEGSLFPAARLDGPLHSLHDSRAS